MARILLEKDDGTTVELKEIRAIPENAAAVLYFMKIYLSENERGRLEGDLERATGKRAIILGPQFRTAIDYQREGKGGERVNRAEIKETLEKQLQLLSQCSEKNVDDPNALVSLTAAMASLTSMNSLLSAMLEQ